MRLRRVRRSGIFAACAILAFAGAARADVAAGDRAWERRAVTLQGDVAGSEAIASAIAHYREAVRARPGSVEARWKLLRALHYASEFTDLPDDAKAAHVDDAVALAKVSQDIDTASASEADRARLLFWSAIAWGARAQRAGLLTIVREGVATRMQENASRSLELDPSVDRGGALRLLSRLHATLPRVPFVSGWVERDRALPLAERAHALDADHPGNRLILALAILDIAPERTAEARALLVSVADAEPRPEAPAEDLAIRKQARERLEQLDGRDD